MDKNDFIKKFVSEREIDDDGIKRESCLVRALEDAERFYCQKDIMKEIVNLLVYEGNKENTHEIKKLLNQFSDIPFLSLIGYLILLDLIGEVFTDAGNNITNAIDYFGSNELKQYKWEVNALRNSLAHNYGLINIPERKAHDVNSLHKFILSKRRNKDIFVRITNWTREDWNDKSETTSTRVYVDSLIEEIKKLHENLKKEVIKGNNKLYLSGGIEELKSRFTIIRTDINDN